MTILITAAKETSDSSAYYERRIWSKHFEDYFLCIFFGADAPSFFDNKENFNPIKSHYVTNNPKRR